MSEHVGRRGACGHARGPPCGDETCEDRDRQCQKCFTQTQSGLLFVGGTVESVHGLGDTAHGSLCPEPAEQHAESTTAEAE